MRRAFLFWNSAQITSNVRQVKTSSYIGIFSSLLSCRSNYMHCCIRIYEGLCYLEFIVTKAQLCVSLAQICIGGRIIVFVFYWCGFFKLLKSLNYLIYRVIGWTRGKKTNRKAKNERAWPGPELLKVGTSIEAAENLAGSELLTRHKTFQAFNGQGGKERYQGTKTLPKNLISNLPC